MLFGEARHSIDAKNRLFIPASQRDELGAAFMAVPSLREKCIRLYSMEQWNLFEDDLKAQLHDDGEKRAKVTRYLHAMAAQLTPDAQGRVLLTTKLIAYTGIEKNVVIVGCGDYAEIWAEAEYERMQEQVDMDFMIDALKGCGL